MTYFALVPAAGMGARMGGDCPKQYQPLLGQPLIRHALQVLTAVPAILRVFVVLAPDDTRWDSFDWSDLAPRLTVLRCGGATRAASVANGLKAMADVALADDWVLVHDAARACLTPAHVEKLLAEVGDDPVGGLLAVPLADTLKRVQVPGLQGPRVAATVPREGLWQAQTPQMFRYGLIVEALEYAPAVTDEASAIEALGLHPRLVAADVTNLKVTYPLDLQLAEWILQNRNR
ncbi:MAG: 2-C-methyl-D-erythritol 4-phosphate cytidylyltransferase [Rhodocyclaceae bacterium]|nr:2-C-methyl-D-erythritol 4-phosphate cytidylyltransferase [Rhodocyclaceae bacterium]